MISCHCGVFCDAKKQYELGERRAMSSRITGCKATVCSVVPAYIGIYASVSLAEGYILLRVSHPSCNVHTNRTITSV
jgi:hypothetical protein